MDQGRYHCLFICFVSLMQIITCEVVEVCPRSVLNSGLNSNVFQHKCYVYHLGTSNSKTFFNAEDDCKSKNGYLVMIKNKLINDFITKSLTQFHERADTWIGLEDIDREGHFKWVDDTDLTQFTNWKHSGDNHYDTDCASIDPYDGTWGIEKCYDKDRTSDNKPYVCEYQAVKTAQTTQPSFTNPQTTPICLDELGHNLYIQNYRHFYFEFVTTKYMVFADANKYCQRHCGTLAKISSRGLNAFVTEQLRKLNHKDSVWIGLSDLKNEGKFLWMDGSVLQYKNFQKNSNNTAENDCVTLNDAKGFWSVEPCESSDMVQAEHAFVCSYEKNNITKFQTYPTHTSITQKMNQTKTTVSLKILTNYIPTSLKVSSPLQSHMSSPQHINTESVKSTSLSGITHANKNSDSSTINEIASTASPGLQPHKSSPRITTQNVKSTPLSASTKSDIQFDSSTINENTMTDTSSMPQESSAAMETSSFSLQSRSSLSKLFNSKTTSTSSFDAKATKGCKTPNCGNDCGMAGYKQDANGCTTCDCMT